MSTSESSAGGMLHPALTYLLPALLALLAHAQAVFFPFMGFDDGMHYLQNPLILEPEAYGLWEHYTTRSIGYPMPFSVLTYQAHHVLFGTNALAAHLVNVLLHAVNTSLVAVCCTRLGGSRFAAVFAGLLFAVHPVVVEPVSWITGRKDLVAACVCLFALLTVCGGKTAVPTARRWLLLGVLSILAMLSKPTAVALPLLLFFIIWERSAVPATEREPRRGLITALSATAVLLAFNLAQTALSFALVERQQGDNAAGVVERLVSTVAAWALSVEHVLLPVNLVPAYFEWPEDPSLVARLIAGLVLIATLYWWIRSPRGTPTRIALGCAALAYSPVAGFAGHARWTSDSYLYFPLACLAIAAGFAAEAGAQRLPSAVVTRWRWPLTALACFCLSTLTLLQAQVWSSPERVWQSVVTRYPQSPVALSELGATFAWMGREQEAQAAYIELDDRFPTFEQKTLPRARARQAQGEHDRVEELLTLGIANGDREAAAAYLQSLMAGGVAPRTLMTDRVHAAFELAFEDFLKQVSDPGAFARLAAVLESASLPQDAARVRTRAPR